MIRPQLSALFAAALGLALQTHAQTGLFLPTGQSLGDAYSCAVALGDLDGDGDKDAFVANYDGTGCQVFLNNGKASFSDSGQLLGKADCVDAALADLDKDGDLDAFVTNYAGACLVFFNDGDGNFTDSSQSLGDGGSVDVALGDLDGDGYVDAFVANYDGACAIYFNNGKGKFTSVDYVGDGKSRGVALGDLDKDGDLDAYVANNGPDKIYLNDGDGNFTVTKQSLGTFDGRRVALADLDGDKDLDAFVVNADHQPCKIWLNDGKAFFTSNGQALGDSSCFGVALADFDDDGDLDAFVAAKLNAADAPAANLLYLNNGSGLFADSGQTLGAAPSTDAAAADLDGDGNLDVFVSNYGTPSTVYLNQTSGSGVFIHSSQTLDSDSFQAVALGDLNADGKPDAFAATNSGCKVFLGQGDGVFADSVKTLGTLNSYGVALGDLDHDGDLDAFVANFQDADGNPEPAKVYLNDGKGGFTDSGQAIATNFASSVALGDFDSDGDLDAFVGNFRDPAGTAQPNRVYLNDGAGVFTDSGQTLGAGGTLAVATADLDGDGDLDVLATNYSSASAVWLNDGKGNFSSSGQALGNGGSVAAALGDLDLDGDLDILIANADKPNKIWTNNGKGVFTNSGQSLGSGTPGGVALADVNGDGNLDAFIAYNYDSDNYPGGSQVWLNDGSGLFSNSLQTLGQSVSTAVALGDFNDDGNPDAFVGNLGPCIVWMNQSPLRSYIINAIAGDNGKISPSGKVLVERGGSQTFTMTPNSKYVVADVKVDGVSIGAVTSHSFDNVDADHSVSVSFAIETLNVTSSAGPGGDISPLGLTPVALGSSLAFTVTPDSGHYLYDLVVDGVSAGAYSTYTFKKITVNHTIAAQFTDHATPVTFDSQLTIAAADLALGSFTKKPSAYFTYMGANGKAAKKTLKVLTKTFPSDAVVCQWSQAVAPGSYSLWIKPAGQKTAVMVKAVHAVMPPELTTATPASGAYPANITLDGRYWGDKSVKVWVYYGTKKVSAKVSRLTFDPTTNVGQIVFALPKQLAKLAAGTVVQLTVQNKIGESPKLPFTVK